MTQENKDENNTSLSSLPKASRKCPIYYEPNADNKKHIVNITVRPGEEIGNPEDIYHEKLCEITGTKNKELANDLINDAAFAINGYSNLGNKKNIVLQSLSEQQPKDLHEARLCAQATALYSQGLNYLDRAHSVLFDEGTFAKDHWHTIFMKAATKLLDLHTKTVMELARYKQNGEQRIIVQHVQVNDGGKAVVGGIFNGGGGK